MTTPNGIPDYADDTSTAYDQGDHPRDDDTAPALPGDEPYELPDDRAGPEEEADLTEGPAVAAEADRVVDEDDAAGFGASFETEALVEDEPPTDEPSLDLDAPPVGETAGRLVAPDLGAGVDDEAEAWGEDTGEVEGLSPEESAMHITDSP